MINLFNSKSWTNLETHNNTDTNLWEKVEEKIVIFQEVKGLLSEITLFKIIIKSDEKRKYRVQERKKIIMQITDASGSLSSQKINWRLLQQGCAKVAASITYLLEQKINAWENKNKNFSEA